MSAKAWRNRRRRARREARWERYRVAYEAGKEAAGWDGPIGVDWHTRIMVWP